jgi:hypothetical protein
MRDAQEQRERAAPRRPNQQSPTAFTCARTTALLGISTGHGGQLLPSAGQNIQRLHSEGAFAALCGASPIPVTSGKRGRYRSTAAATAKPTEPCT